jgi:hypothetical protein
MVDGIRPETAVCRPRPAELQSLCSWPGKSHERASRSRRLGEYNCAIPGNTKRREVSEANQRPAAIGHEPFPIGQATTLAAFSNLWRATIVSGRYAYKTQPKQTNGGAGAQWQENMAQRWSCRSLLARPFVVNCELRPEPPDMA